MLPPTVALFLSFPYVHAVTEDKVKNRFFTPGLKKSLNSVLKV